jgi:tRNA(Ile)-lysidine synthase
VERKEIEEYLSKESIPFQIDSTNLTDSYSRNKIRNKILSYAVTEINSGAIDNINTAAVQLREAKEYIEANVKTRYQVLVKQTNSLYRISVKAFIKEPPVIQKEIIRRIMENLALSKKDLEARHVESVIGLCQRQVGKYIHLPYDMIAEREYEEIKFYRGNEFPEETDENVHTGSIQAVIPGRTILPKYKKIIETEIINYKKSKPIPKSSCTKWFNYDKIENAVEIRTRREGDYIQINEAGGKKKIKDYFIDKKIPRRQRDNQILIADGSHIMWIPGIGERMSEKYKVDENTSKVLLMKMLDMEDNADDR